MFVTRLACALLTTLAIGACTSQPSPPALWSSDGTVTQTLLGPLGDDPQDDELTVRSVAAGGPGFVAVGGSAWGPTFWTSTDGSDWQLAPDDPAMDGRWVPVLVRGGAGLVALAGDGTAWTSDDGQAWGRGSAEAAIAAGPNVFTQVLAAERLADGSLIAAAALQPRGEVTEDSGTIGVWHSSDGVAWRRLDGPTIPAGYDPRADITAFGDGWVVVGQRAVAISADGDTWQTVSPPEPLVAVAATGGGRLVAAGYDVEEGRAGQAWISDDGLAWTSTVVDLPASAYEIGLVTAEDGHTWLFAGDGTTTSLWRTVDGSSWEKVESSLLAGSSVALAAATGERLVLVGSRHRPDEPEHTKSAAAWTLPAVEVADPKRSAPARAPWVEPKAPALRDIPGLELPPGTVMAPMADGRVLLTGHDPGRRGAEATPGDVRLLDPVTGATEAAEPLPPGTRPWDAALGPDGSVNLVVSDLGVITVLRRDPLERFWTTSDTYPDLGQVTFDEDEGGWYGAPELAVLGDGRVVLAGPQEPAQLIVLDPASGMDSPSGGSGSAVAPFSGNGLALASTADGAVVAIAGGRAWRSTDGLAWEAIARLPHVGDGRPAVAALADGRVAVVMPGVAGPGKASERREYVTIDLLDLVTGAWSSGGGLAEPVVPGATVALPDVVALPEGRFLLVLRGYRCPVDSCEGEGMLERFSRAVVVELP